MEILTQRCTLAIRVPNRLAWQDSTRDASSSSHLRRVERQGIREYSKLSAPFFPTRERTLAEPGFKKTMDVYLRVR